jgi:hypothetical protein
LIGLAAGISGSGWIAAQTQQPPKKKAGSKTVTLSVSGMT